MARAWVNNIAVRDISLRETELASAIAYADPTRKGWIFLTRTGEVVAQK
jgi:hypothetical protein